MEFLYGGNLTVGLSVEVCEHITSTDLPHEPPYCVSCLPLLLAFSCQVLPAKPTSTGYEYACLVTLVQVQLCYFSGTFLQVPGSVVSVAEDTTQYLRIDRSHSKKQTFHGHAR